MKRSTLKKKCQEIQREKSRQKIFEEMEIYSLRSLCDFNVDDRRACLNCDNDSEPDRSNPPWKISLEDVKQDEESGLGDKNDDLKEGRETISIWEDVMNEYEDERVLWMHLREETKPFEPELPSSKKLTTAQYLQKHIFSLLCPILEETLSKAQSIGCLKARVSIQKCRFSGLDYISELLWNRNPMHPERHGQHLDIFDIPFVKDWLRDHPRPIYPLSWLWTEDEAITVMQSYIRRYLVCSEPDCAEMREFWKIIRAEKEEELKLKEQKSFESAQAMINDILNTVAANAVFKAEYKRHGCKCSNKTKKHCHCECKCDKWCKCCKCYKKGCKKSSEKSEPCISQQVDD